MHRNTHTFKHSTLFKIKICKKMYLKHRYSLYRGKKEKIKLLNFYIEFILYCVNPDQKNLPISVFSSLDSKVIKKSANHSCFKLKMKNIILFRAAIPFISYLIPCFRFKFFSISFRTSLDAAKSVVFYFRSKKRIESGYFPY